MFSDGAAPVPESDSPGGEQTPQAATKVRTEFPETWLWSESTTGYQLSDICAVKFSSLSMSKLSENVKILRCPVL